MVGINFTANNVSLFFVGSEAIPDSFLYVGWQAILHEYGWWLLIVMGVLFLAFMYTKHFVLAIMLTLTLAVNIWWIEYADIPTVPLLLARCCFLLLIAFVWLYLLQARKVRYVDSGQI